MMRAAKASLRLAAGAWQFARRRTTPNYAYQSLIQLFCLTGGRSNDLLARMVGLVRPPYRLSSATGVLGDLSSEEMGSIAARLREQGYYMFPRRLPAEICSRLLHFAATQPCAIRPTDADVAKGVGSRVTVYDRTAPKGIIYEFDPDHLVNNSDVQALMADPSIVAIAQAYIGSRPVLDEVNLWWSTAYETRPDASAAQLYHFDMDRIRWLKFFIYLTDVGPDNGPHCFVSGSHRTGGIPERFLSRGYARLQDSEVRTEYPADAFIDFMGSIGTIIAEDTRGLHKGRPVISGDRLVLEFEFSNSLFGATPLKVSRFHTFYHSEVEHFIRSHPRMYERWLARAETRPATYVGCAPGPLADQ